MSDRVPQRYFILMQLDKSSDFERISEYVPVFRRVLEDAAKAPLVNACISNDLKLSGFFTKTSKHPGILRKAFNECPATINKDQLLIIEIGEDHAAFGFSSEAAWLRDN